jgi:AcrR family transcriptional regulator
MGRHAHNARESIIDAAEDTVIEVGARHLTLDAVAAKAGVSKGGLIYHFSNKEALLDAMLSRRLKRIEENRQNTRATLQEGPRSEIIAYVLSSLEQDSKTRKLSVALLAAVAHDPQLLVPYREEYRRLLEEFSKEGVRFKRAAAIMLAVDGMRLMELLSMTPFTAKERNDVIEEIIALAKDEKHD